MGPYLFLSLGGYHMKLTKSLLLASAAGLAAVATASAADLPSKKAAPVEYVKVCPSYGPGFFYIPGSDTCVKIGGTVFGEYAQGQRFNKSDAASGWYMRVRPEIDARQNTEYGLLRTVIMPSFNYRTGGGGEPSSSANNQGLNFQGLNENYKKQTQVNVEGWVQLGGLTVGRTFSMFSPIGPNANIGLDGRDQRDQTNMFAYTASFGNGFTATIAAEDGASQARDGILSTNGTSLYAAAKAPALNNDGTLKTAGVSAVGSAVTYGGANLPDFVANLMVDQAWGKVVASGAVHQITYSTRQFSTDYGYAGQLAAKINLPMIATGDYLFLSGIYTNGASGYSLRNVAGDRASQDITGTSGTGTGYGGSFGVGQVGVTMNDVVVNTTTGATEKASVYGASAEFGHQFTPTVLAYVGGSYTKLDWSATAQSWDNGTQKSIQPASIYRVELGAQWTPVKGFTVWPEVSYSKVNAKSAVSTISTEPAKKSADAYTGRIRISRSF
jgi:Porin subfamily